ncbi:MAG: prepilin-type N-terminal cleavage/methylation domain-containing protein [Planctomycetota bacterium]
MARWIRSSTAVGGKTWRRSGFTLIELITALLILAVLAALVVPQLPAVFESAERDATLSSLDTIRQAIVGHRGAALPTGYLADVRRHPVTLRDLYIAPSQVPLFDPLTAIGWRGPYLTTATASYTLTADDVMNGFTTDYGSIGDPALPDAWGHAIVLQVPDPDADAVFTPDDHRHARLVSAGPDGKLTTPRTDAAAEPPGNALYPARAQCGDDLVLYLHLPDLRP